MGNPRRAFLICSILAASLTAPASAEESHKNLCVGTGSATLGAGISYFPTTTANVSFTFTFNCATGGSVTGSGTLTLASCGHSRGSGTFTGVPEKPFSVLTAGSMLVIYGPNGTYGVGNATPLPDTSTIPFGNSCSNGTARVFTLVGSVCSLLGTGIGCPDLPDDLRGPCVGTGTLATDVPLNYWPSVASNVGFSFTLDCPFGRLQGSGVFETASCDLASGYGVVNSGGDPYDFRIDLAGAEAVLSPRNGDVVMGALTVLPAAGQSCLPSRATRSAEVFVTAGVICAGLSDEGGIEDTSACMTY